MASDSDRSGAETSFTSTGALKMVAGSYYAPKLNPSKPYGEDAHFIYTKAQAIGVADGVGGWAFYGIDSGVYARKLMTNAVLFISENIGAPVDPKMVLEQAWLRTKEKGSSTACILTVHDDLLQAVNVGDSGFLHFRDGKVIYKSPVQYLGSRCPLQLSAFSGDFSKAMEIKLNLAPGDIIIAGTDGLFDNAHSEEIQQLVIEGLENDKIDMAKMAKKIGKFALEKALDPNAYTPYAKECIKDGTPDALGGKYDDITVVVAYIIPASSEGDDYRSQDICPEVITLDDFAIPTGELRGASGTGSSAPDKVI